MINSESSIGQFNQKYKKVVYTPSESFKKMIVDNENIISIDLRFLQIARMKNIALVHDLYIYLIQRSYKRSRDPFVPWSILHKEVFPYLSELCESRFKVRFIRALEFILVCHPQFSVRIDNKNSGIHISRHHGLLRSASAHNIKSTRSG